MACAQDTAAAMDEAVKNILDECYAKAVGILKDSREDMDKVRSSVLSSSGIRKSAWTKEVSL